MQELRNNIRLKTFIPLTIHDGDTGASLEGSAIDTREVDEDGSPLFDFALVSAVIGSVGADVTATTVYIEESDASDFATSSVAEGGEAQDVIAGDTTVNFEVKRTKRYLRAVLTVEEDGVADDVEVAVVGILSNWAKPLPIV